MSQDLPQRYGTQFLDTGSGWVRWHFNPTTSDEQRAAWNVPTLAQLKQTAVDMNMAEQSETEL